MCKVTSNVAADAEYRAERKIGLDEGSVGGL